MSSPHAKQYRALQETSLHALGLEEAAMTVLKETNLSPEDRETLEKAVRVARAIQKTPGGGKP